jgi:hypothetical protein
LVLVVLASDGFEALVHGQAGDGNGGERISPPPSGQRVEHEAA